jgi:hypothetical protein
MFDGGHRLKCARLDGFLTYRDVELLSRILSERYADDRYTVRISVLVDIEDPGIKFLAHSGATPLSESNAEPLVAPVNVHPT